MLADLTCKSAKNSKVAQSHSQISKVMKRTGLSRSRIYPLFLFI